MAKEDDDSPTELPPLFIRERMKVTGERLAEEMSTTPATVSRLLNGKRKMTLEWLYAFSKALGTPIAEFFEAPGSGAAKVSKDEDIRALLRRIDKLPEDAIAPLMVFIAGYQRDAELQRQAQPRDQSGSAIHHHEEQPSR